MAVPKAKAAKAEAIKDDPASMRRSISRMLTSLKYKADPTKNKKKEGFEDAQKVLAAAKLYYVLMFSGVSKNLLKFKFPCKPRLTRASLTTSDLISS